jgi:hypothetical protein
MNGIFLRDWDTHKRVIRATNILKTHVYPGIGLIRETHLELQNPVFSPTRWSIE